MQKNWIFIKSSLCKKQPTQRKNEIIFFGLFKKCRRWKLAYPPPPKNKNETGAEKNAVIAITVKIHVLRHQGSTSYKKDIGECSILRTGGRRWKPGDTLGQPKLLLEWTSVGISPGCKRGLVLILFQKRACVGAHGGAGLYEKPTTTKTSTRPTTGLCK